MISVTWYRGHFDVTWYRGRFDVTCAALMSVRFFHVFIYQCLFTPGVFAIVAVV